MAVTGHHLILSLAEVQEKQGPREIWLLHRNIQAIGRGEESGGRSGTITLRFVICRMRQDSRGRWVLEGPIFCIIWTKYPILGHCVPKN